jgi:acyl transferase domain-containing protein/thioesterase domain-containing protein/aryl carrier-like protein
VQTACSTSLVAVCLACQALASGQCDAALAGGVSLGERVGYLYRKGMILSPDGHCRAFDIGATGTVPGDGVGAVVLKRLDEAQADGDPIRAVVRGYAVNNDGANKPGFTAPRADGQAAVIGRALAGAGVHPGQVGYVEAHGTATPLGDAVEVGGLTSAFRAATGGTGFCAIGSVKTNIGHLDAAAGVAGLIKTILALEHGEIPPSLHYRSPNPELHLEDSPFHVNARAASWPEDRPCACVSSFGIGGTNAHAVLERPPAASPPAVGAASRPELIVTSAGTPAALERRRRDLAMALAGSTGPGLPDIAFTLQQGRRQFAHRDFVVAASAADASARLAAPSPRVMEPVAADPSVAFLFAGQGVRYVLEGSPLREHEPRFGATVDRCMATVRARGGPDLAPLLSGSADSAGDGWTRTELAQPALFSLQYALAELLMDWGVRPAAVLGHSVGEFAAACIAGVMSLDDALGLITVRGALMATSGLGRMLAVRMPEARVREHLAPGLDLAAVNSPSDCVVSGGSEEIECLRRRLEEQGEAARLLDTTRAFHSSTMDDVLEPFRAYVEATELRPPSIEFISSATGARAHADELTDPEYWVRQLRDTVRFADALGTLSDAGHVGVEVGPGRTLAALALRQGGQRRVLSTLGEPDRTPERGRVLAALGDLWTCGVEVDWAALHHGARRRVHLPTYPFEPTHFARASRPLSPRGGAPVPAPGSDSSATPTTPAPAVKRPDPADWFSTPIWRAAPVPKAARQPARHWVLLADRDGWADALATRLGAGTVTVHRGSRFEQLGEHAYSVNPADAGDLDALWADLDARGRQPDAIAHLWCLGGPDRHPRRAFDDPLQSDPASLLRVVQSWGRRASRPLRLVAVTDRAHTIGEPAAHPEQATILGLCRVIPAEYEEISCLSIDAIAPPGAGAPTGWIDQLDAELRAEPGEPLVALRPEGRFALTNEPLPLPPAPAPHPRLRPAGTYLITGGLGGIGLSIAGLLARDRAAKVVLLSRSGDPSDRHAAPRDPEHEELTRRQRRLQALRHSGCEVVIHAADVTDPDAMAAVVTEATERFGAIHGVVHAAGLTSGGVMQSMTPDRLASTLAPKVAGTVVLAKALEGQQLDFFVLCSSLAAQLGGFGQADYCAANCFLDAYAQQQSALGKTVTAIDWDGWQEVGALARSAARRDLAATRGPDPLQNSLLPGEGNDAFARILASGAPQVLVSTVALHTRHGARVDDTGQPPAFEPHGGDHDRASSITAIWSDLLGTETVGDHENFFELGGDSLMAVQAVHRMRSALGIDLPTQSLIEHPTICALLNWLDTETGGAGPVAPNAHLVCLNAGAERRRPLFFVHPAGGHVYFYRFLAKALDSTQPVWGLKAQGLEGGVMPLESVPDMAAQYVAAAQEIQPHGPYILGGSSFGGMVAFEMAQQLVVRGESVELVVMVDTPAPTSRIRDLDDQSAILAYLLAKGAADDDEVDRLRALSPDERLALFISQGAAAERISPDASPADVGRYLDVFRANMRAMRAHTPRPYGGDVLFFKPAEHDGVNARDAERDWHGLLTGRLDVTTVPGNHITMNLSPNVEDIATHLDARLRVPQPERG